jgi:tetratricopeptide (TPR) repeat protein
MQRAISQGQSAARDSAQTYYLNAARMASEGRYVPSIEAMKKAIEFLPNEPRLRSDLASLILASGDKPAAIRELEALAGQIPPYAPAVVQLGDLRLADGDTAAAIQAYQSVVGGVLPYALAYVRLGDVAQDQGKRTDAVRMYQQATSVDSTLIEGWLSLGSVFVIMDRYTDALAAFDHAINQAPEDETAGNLRSLAQQRKQDYEEGVAARKMRARMIVAATREQADSYRRRLVAGADFIAMAHRLSVDATSEVGGDLGFFGEGDLIPAFEQAVKALRPGQMSPVIQLPSGYAIILRVN